MLSAADGALGVEYARACLPQVILMDINLPGMSGIEAMKILRDDPVTAHIPIIALSANAVPRDIEKGAGGRVLQLHHQADQGQPVHGSAGRGPGVFTQGFPSRLQCLTPCRPPFPTRSTPIS